MRATIDPTGKPATRSQTDAARPPNEMVQAPTAPQLTLNDSARVMRVRAFDAVRCPWMCSSIRRFALPGTIRSYASSVS